MIDVTKLEVALPIWIAEAIQQHRRFNEVGPREVILPARMYSEFLQQTSPLDWDLSSGRTMWRKTHIRRGDADGEAVIIGYDGVSRTI